MIEATVRLNQPDWDSEHKYIDESPINIWLLSNVGVHARFRDMVNEDRPWHIDHENGYLIYSFAREQDALLFSLKWSQ